jgi:NAD(P)H-dependent FMN reductase
MGQRTVIKAATVIGSIRPGRIGEAVAHWVSEIAGRRSDAEFELVDIEDFNLPLLDEPVPPSQGKYSKEHTKAWAAKVDSYDAYVFVTPEYNPGPSGALKNALDYLYREWNNAGLQPAAERRSERARIRGGAGAGARGHRERATQRRAGDADVLHQRPPLCGHLG